MTVASFISDLASGSSLFVLILTVGVGLSFVDLIITSIRRALS